MKPRQMKLLRTYRRRKRDTKLRPATKDCGQCENMLGHSWIEEGKRVKFPATRCEHKGRGYLVNGFLYMVLCVCCVTRLKRKCPTMQIAETT